MIGENLFPEDTAYAINFEPEVIHTLFNFISFIQLAQVCCCWITKTCASCITTSCISLNELLHSFLDTCRCRFLYISKSSRLPPPSLSTHQSIVLCCVLVCSGFQINPRLSRNSHSAWFHLIHSQRWQRLFPLGFIIQERVCNSSSPRRTWDRQMYLPPQCSE